MLRIAWFGEKFDQKNFRTILPPADPVARTSIGVSGNCKIVIKDPKKICIPPCSSCLHQYERLNEIFEHEQGNMGIGVRGIPLSYVDKFISQISPDMNRKPFRVSEATDNIFNFRSRQWWSSFTVCAHLTVCWSPYQHEQIFMAHMSAKSYPKFRNHRSTFENPPFVRPNIA